MNRVAVITLDRVINYINNMGLDEKVQATMIKKAKSIPYGSLGHFFANINTYTANCTKSIYEKNQQN